MGTRYLHTSLRLIPALLVAFGTGNNQGWFSPGLAKLKEGLDAPFEVPASQLANFPVYNIVGGWISLLWMFIARDYVSRRTQLTLGFLSSFTSWILTAFASTIWTMYVAKLFGGFAVGQCYLVTPIYLAEISPDKIRGTACALFETALLVGTLVANGIVPQMTLYLSSILFMLVPLVGVFLLYALCPESPYYLEMKGRSVEALVALRKLRGTKQIDREYHQIKETVALQLTNTSKFSEIYSQANNRRAVLIIAGVLTIQVYSGFGFMQIYLHIVIKEITTIPVNPLAFSILIIHCISSLICSYLIERLGKRTLVISSTIGCAVLMTIFAVCRHLMFLDYRSNILSLIAVGSLVLFLIFHSSGIGLVPLAYTGELFPLNIKMYGVFLIKFYLSSMCMSSYKFHQFFSTEINSFIEYYIYACVSIIGIIFVFRVVPETRGKSFHEIQLLLGAKYQQVPLSDDKKNESEILEHLSIR